MWYVTMYKKIKCGQMYSLIFILTNELLTVSNTVPFNCNRFAHSKSIPYIFYFNLVRH